MIIGHKTEAYPVPGVMFDGRQLFIEILPKDNESTIKEAAAFIERALKQWANEHPQIKVIKTLGSKIIRPGSLNLN